MKKLFISFVWQWRFQWEATFNPICIEFCYDRYVPAISLYIIVMGVGLQLTWLVSWKTTQSKLAEECEKQLKKLFVIER